MAVHETWDVEASRLMLASLSTHERLILPALQKLQSTFGFVHDDDIDLVAEELNVSRAEVVGVLTFYHDLRTSAPPKRVVQLCLAEACRAVGAQALADELRRRNVPFEIVYCLGNCALGPAAQIDGRLRARCDAASLIETSTFLETSSFIEASS